jgi:hypothetical protein
LSTGRVALNVPAAARADVAQRGLHRDEQVFGLGDEVREAAELTLERVASGSRRHALRRWRGSRLLHLADLARQVLVVLEELLDRLGHAVAGFRAGVGVLHALA